jgi:uncharacterized protein (TIGR02598 family)
MIFSRQSKIAPPPGTPCSRKAFSLIEVTLALAVVSFSMLTIAGLLPIGLSTLSSAATRTGEANIAKEMSSELEQIPLSEITGLSQTTYYYDRGGNQVLQNSSDAFFSASFVANSPHIPGTPGTYPSVAQTVVVTLHYPQNIGASFQKSLIFSLFVAQQSGN